MKKRNSKWILGLMTLPLIATMACSVQPYSGESEAGNSKAIVQLDRKANNNVDETSDYTLGYGDVVEVKFFNNEQYNETVAIRPDGKISLQRVGDILVVGMTTMQLTKIITDAYSEILINPEVTVIVREFGGQEFYVMGEVAKPGKYPISKGMTILRALATAGGAKNSAKLSSVILLRADKQHRAEATRINLDLASLRKQPRQDLPLKPFDVVYVPRTFIADVNNFISQYYDILLPPLDIWTRYMIWNQRY